MIADTPESSARLFPKNSSHADRRGILGTNGRSFDATGVLYAGVDTPVLAGVDSGVFSRVLPSVRTRVHSRVEARWHDTHVVWAEPRAVDGAPS